MKNKTGSIKGKLPFRIGCTSYVYPDDIVPNVHKMAPIVDDIELILFESDDVSNFPDKDTIDELGDIADEYRLTYTVHFPTDKDAGSGKDKERLEFSEQIERIIELTNKLNPYAYILHLQGINNNASVSDITLWKKNCYEFCQKISELSYLDPKKICVENFNYPPEWHLDIVNDFSFSFCMDIGHFWMEEYKNWDILLKKTLEKTRAIHLHGVRDGKDHISLINSKIEDVLKVFDIMKHGYKHVVTLEIFNKKELFESLQLIEKLLVINSIGIVT
jgi:sugar phosphate isomerase/epimerase